MKFSKNISLVIFCIFFSSQIFSQETLQPLSEFFFTKAENGYSLQIPNVEPREVQMELPELPLGTKFLSSKKEEFHGKDGTRGTQITMWFDFAYSGVSQISPLLVKINGTPLYFEFERVIIHENPNFISPALEIQFEKPLAQDKKTGQSTLSVQKGENIYFTILLRYGVQVLDYKWIIPDDSIFLEAERFDFANGNTKITEFSDKATKLSKFEWKILKEGTYSLPNISVKTISYNGTQKDVGLVQNVFVSVSGGKKTENTKKTSQPIFSSAFEKPQDEYGADSEQTERAITRKECETLAKKEKRTIFQRLFGKKYAIFLGGNIFSVPEEKSKSQTVPSGQKVKIIETAGEWSFIDGSDFSGWAKIENLFEIK